MVDPERVLKSTKLPSLPSVAVQLIELSRDPDAGVSEFAKIIRTDPALSAKILKAANSAYFGLASNVTSVETAVPLLGSTVVISLALSFSLIGEDSQAHTLKRHCDHLWSRSLLHAVTAETLAKRIQRGLPAQGFLAGLLCDIGVLAHINSIPLEYAPVLAEVEASGQPLQVVEREHLGFDHIDIGIALMETWRMPITLIETVRHHHADCRGFSDKLDTSNQSVVRSVQFAVKFGELLSGRINATALEGLQQLRELACEFADFPENTFDSTLNEIRTATDDYAKLMSINTSSLPRPAELLAQANSQLVEIALREHVSKSEVTVRSAVLELENRKLKLRNNELNLRAGVDSLTGLSNRGAFDEYFHKLVDSCLRDSQSIGVIFADIDNFKHLNDTYGHPFGDEVLHRVARVIRSQVRDSDLVARYGGEEFVVITSKCPEAVIAGIAERIRSRVESEEFVCQGQPIGVTISVGACVTTDRLLPMLNASTLASSILQEADSAMYYCKRTGRNQTLLKRWEAQNTPAAIGFNE